jgi:hypothetical protein
MRNYEYGIINTEPKNETKIKKKSRKHRIKIKKTKIDFFYKKHKRKQKNFIFCLYFSNFVFFRESLFYRTNSQKNI